MKYKLTIVCMVALWSGVVQAQQAATKGSYSPAFLNQQLAISFPQEVTQSERALFNAVLKNEYKTAKQLLISEQVNPNVRDDLGNAPLQYAQSLRMVRLLVEYGADVNSQNKNGIARLHTDVVFGRVRYVRYLLDHGADASRKTRLGATPLHYAVAISYYEDPSPLKKMLTAAFIGGAITGAFVIPASMLGIYLIIGELAMILIIIGGLGVSAIGITVGAILTAIGTAVSFLSVDITVRNRILGLLLAQQVDLNAQDEEGNTPLHVLAGGRLLKPGNRRAGILMAERLVLQGANVTVRNNQGKMPYEVALDYFRFPLALVLRPGDRRSLKSRVREAFKMINKEKAYKVTG